MRPRSLFEGGGISSIARTLDRPTSIPLTIKPRSIPADIPKTHFFGFILNLYFRALALSRTQGLHGELPLSWISQGCRIPPSS